MGYFKHNDGTKYFSPDNTDTELWLNASYDSFSFEELKEIILARWPDADTNKVNISTEYIHTDCLDYDLYDPSDYTLYLKLEYVK